MHSPSNDAWEATEAQLVRAADRLSGIIEMNNLTGFTGLSVDVPNNGLLLRWKGTVPEPLQSAMATIRTTGITVTAVEARYSLVELKEHMRELWAAERLANVPEEFRVQRVSPANDGSGLEISVIKRNPDVEKARSKFPISRTDESGGAVFL